jgi:CheY-like chemotaxis protein
MLPIQAEIVSGEWTLTHYALLVGVLLCAAAMAIFAVPDIASHWRRWRKNRCIRPLMKGSKSPSPSIPAPRADAVPDAEHGALDWPAADVGDDSSMPGVESGCVLGREKTVLIADDDPVVSLALSQRIRRLGFTVLRTADAMHALLGVKKILPDLVILDLQMPSGNGLAVCEMMACDQSCANIPVIVHSVFRDEAVRRRCQQLGARYVVKSSDSWTEIKDLIETLIGGDATTKQEVGMPSRNAILEKSPASPASEIPDLPPTEPSASGPLRVLCIGSSQGRLDSIDEQLSALGMIVAKTSDFEHGFWESFIEKPNVIIVQTTGNEKKVVVILRRFAAHPVTRGLPVILLNDGDAIDSAELPAAVNLKILPSPLHGEDLLCELEGLLSGTGPKTSDLPASEAGPAAENNAAAPVPPRMAHEKVPRATSAAMDEPAKKADGQHMVVPIGRKPLTVLCIDDDPVLIRAIAVRLQPYGIKVKSADNGTQGYLMVVAEKPDIILLDLKMPNGAGNYVLGKLQDNPNTKDIPVVVVTMETTAGVRRQMLSLGADGFLNKPVHWPELFAEMGHCVQLPRQLLIDYGLPEQLTIQEL